MNRHTVAPFTTLALLLLVSCGEGTINSGEGSNGQSVNPLQFLPDLPGIPQFRWSLVSYSIDDVETMVEQTEPDPNWLSNYFVTDTLANPDLNAAGVMDCEQYRLDYEYTSRITIRIDIGESVGTVEGCIINTPEGLLRSVLADYTTVMLTGMDDGTIDITNGNGVIVTLAPFEVN